jgi:hypothetical protein
MISASAHIGAGVEVLGELQKAVGAIGAADNAYFVEPMLSAICSLVAPSILRGAGLKRIIRCV